MSLDLANYEDLARQAVKAFWGNRNAAMERQIASGRQDAGTRGAVTSGKNMDGFVVLAEDLVKRNGLTNANVCLNRGLLALPGFFRPTKLWDMLVIQGGRLVAALEFKSHIGPSFSNNFNNRIEEAIGTAHDLWTAYQMGALGTDVPRPFLGWVMLVEDCPASRAPIREAEPHFAVFPEFKRASYAARYDLLCKKLVQENLYASSSCLLSPRAAVSDGQYCHMSELTSLKTFVTAFAGHIAAIAAR
jgi:hypothetical protein